MVLCIERFKHISSLHTPQGKNLQSTQYVSQLMAIRSYVACETTDGTTWPQQFSTSKQDNTCNYKQT